MYNIAPPVEIQDNMSIIDVLLRYDLDKPAETQQFVKPAQDIYTLYDKEYDVYDVIISNVRSAVVQVLPMSKLTSGIYKKSRAQTIQHIQEKLQAKFGKNVEFSADAGNSLLMATITGRGLISNNKQDLVILNFVVTEHSMIAMLELFYAAGWRLPGDYSAYNSSPGDAYAIKQKQFLNHIVQIVTVE